MVRPFEDLPRIMENRAQQVGDGVNRLQKRAARAVDTEVVRRTPVDKGVARSNWVVTRNTPFSGVIPAYAPGRRLGIEETANANGAISQGAVAIGAFDVNRDRSIHITNNVGHIGLLNDGSSSQAPALFVQMGIQAGLISLSGARVLGR